MTQPSQYKENLGDPRWHTKLNAGLDALWDMVNIAIPGFTTLINNWAIEDQIVTMIPVTCTYSDADTFTLPGDYTTRFATGAVVQVHVAAGMVYSTVASSSYAAPTTTVNLVDAVLTDPLTRVYVVATRDGLWPNGPGYVVARDYGTDRAALEAADAVAAAAGKELRITYAYAIDDDVTLNAPKVTVQPGVPFEVGDTFTLTINGTLDAGHYKIFTRTGTGTVIFGAMVPRVLPEWVGAEGDNSTDDGAAINLAADIARASSCKRIKFSSRTGYATSTQIDLTRLNVEMLGKIYSDLTGAERILCGDGVDLDIVIMMDGDATSRAGTTGIHVTDIQNSRLYLSTMDSETGITFEPSSDGFIAYNIIELGRVTNCDIGLYVHVPSGGTAAANENIVIGGNFGAAAGLTTCECGVKLLSENANIIDNWVFQKPCFELLPTETTAAIITEKAQNCHFDDVRFECGADMPVALFNDNSNNIIVDLAVAGGRPVFWQCEPYADTTYGCYGCEIRKTGYEPIIQLTEFSSFRSAYNDGTYYHVPGFQFINDDAGTVSRKSNATQYLMDGSANTALKTGVAGTTPSIGISAVFGTVESSWTKNLIIVPQYYGSGSSNLRVSVSCFDATGAALHGTSPAYAQGSRWAEITGASGYRYLFYPYLPSTGKVVISLHPDVVIVRVGIYTAEPLEGLQIYTTYPATGFLEYTGVKETPDKLLAANSPTKWHFQVGDTVLDDSPTSGQQQGWVCVKRVDMTLTDGEPITETSMVVDDSTGVVAGDIVGVQLDTGAYHFTTAAAVPDGTHVTLTAGLPSAAAATNKVVANLWNALPNLP